jgi:hypothetical protein
LILNDEDAFWRLLCPISKKVAGTENESSIAKECLALIYKKMPKEYC